MYATGRRSTSKPEANGSLSELTARAQIIAVLDGQTGERYELHLSGDRESFTYFRTDGALPTFLLSGL